MPISDYFDCFRSKSLTIVAERRSWITVAPHHPFFYSCPRSLSELRTRIRRNIKYFRMNYVYIVLSILFLSLFLWPWHPISIIVYLILLVVWWFLYLSREDNQLVVLHRVIDDRLVTVVLGILTVVALALTGVWLNVLVSILIGVAIVVVHASFRISEDFFLDEGEEEERARLSFMERNEDRIPYIHVPSMVPPSS